ncbi:MAG: nucleotidyltransferase family protein [Pseudomonadota bacterium]|nr:nucleotidyltransferase family protein [Pseudomonadota bacterium]|tara:strand:- start:44 stop:652 length:609 start_codon:yes stop_codon:yes gene_type:complete
MTVGKDIHAVLLAAGRSERMGRNNKLLLNVDGIPLVRKSAINILNSNVTSITVVTGFDENKIVNALSGLNVNFVKNINFREGLSSSLKAGLANITPTPSAVIICLADMPKIQPEHINQLIENFNPLKGWEICIPTNNGKRGNPVLIGSRFFPYIFETNGDFGAKQIMKQHSDKIVEVEIGTSDIHFDIDTQDEYENFTTRSI